MQVLVKRSALEELVRNLAEDKNLSSALQNIVSDPGSDEPILPSDQMAVQLSADVPPVGDPEYLPVSTDELSRSASVISQEVPQDQIDFFYRQLHRLLDAALDRHEDDLVDVVSEERFREIVSQILNEADDSDKIDGAEFDRELTIENPDSIDDIVEMILSQKLHIVNLKDPDTGKVASHPAVLWDESRKDFVLGSKSMKVLASAGSVDKLVKSIVQGNDDIARNLFRYARENNIGTDEAKGELATALAPYLGKDEPPITPELAAEMSANITSDQLMKIAEGDIDEYTQLIDSEIEKLAKHDVVKVKISGGESQKIVEAPAVLIVKFLKRARGKVISGEQKDVYSQEEADRELGEEISEEEKSILRKQVRKEMREEALESEYEPGKFILSQKALRALMDRIANEMGTGLGNVRNIIYDDLKMMGIDPEAIRKMMGLKSDEKLPYGRGKIPPIYDPLLFKASEEIIEKSYEIFRYAFEKYIDSLEDDNQKLAFRKFYENLYQPGMNGYIRLQDVTGNVDDLSSSKFKKSREGFEVIQVFIDQLARNFVPEETHKQAKEGGIRAFILDIKNSDALAPENRSEFDEFLDKKIRILNRFKKDEDLLFDMLEASLDKSKKRAAKYIRQLEKERSAKAKA
jgi:hypothetical protein